MNFSDDILQKMEDYLDGNMSKEDIANFEIQIRNNQELEDYVILNKEMRVSYDESNWSFIEDSKPVKDLKILEDYFKSDEIEKAKGAIKNVNKSYNIKSNSSENRTKYYSYFAIAATLIILLGYFIFSEKSLTTEQLYSQYNDWSELPSLVSRSDSADTILAKGENAFLSENYKDAIIYFEEYMKENEILNPSVLLYLGISQLELNQFKNSIETFNILIDSDAIDSSKGYWYKTLLYLKMNNRDKATKELDLLLKNAENFNYKEAKRLRADLEN